LPANPFSVAMGLLYDLGRFLSDRLQVVVRLTAHVSKAERHRLDGASRM
jgi:hypothetical protein